MADYTITPENVRAPTGASIRPMLAAQNIGPGNFVFDLNATHVDIANATNVNAARVSGFTVDFAYTGQPIGVVSAGTVTLGNAALPNGHVIMLSPNAGKACNHADVPAGNYVTPLGVVNSPTTVLFAINPTGIVRA